MKTTAHNTSKYINNQMLVWTRIFLNVYVITHENLRAGIMVENCTMLRVSIIECNSRSVKVPTRNEHTALCILLREIYCSGPTATATEASHWHMSVNFNFSFFRAAWNAKARPRPTQPSIPPGSVNEYQLRLGRQRQVWFIPLADERGVCR